MEYTLGELSRKTGVSIQRLRKWTREGYLIGYGKKEYPNGKTGYIFGNEHINQVLRVIGLRKLGHSLGSAWIIVERDLDKKSLDELMDD